MRVWLHTDGTTNCYHLQVAAFESPGEGRVCGVCCSSLWVEHVAIRAAGRLWRHGHGHGEVGVPLEAVEDAAAQSLVVAGRFAIVVGSLGRSSEALFGSVHVVVHGRQGSSKTEAGRAQSSSARLPVSLLESLVNCFLPWCEGAGAGL